MMVDARVEVQSIEMRCKYYSNVKSGSTLYGTNITMIVPNEVTRPPALQRVRTTARWVQCQLLDECTYALVSLIISRD